MEMLEAHRLFGQAERPAWLPLPIIPGVPPDAVFAIVATGGVALAGRLEYCSSRDDLADAFDSFAESVAAGEISALEWRDASLRVLAELMQAGEAFAQAQRTLAESN